MLQLRKAGVADARAITELIAPFAAADLMLPRRLPQLYEAIRDFHVLYDDGQLVGCAALHVFDGELAEVKSLAVAAAAHGRGHASRLVGACLDEARALGLAKVFALVLRSDLWEKLGFVCADKETLPQKVFGECLFCPKFERCDELAVVYAL